MRTLQIEELELVAGGVDTPAPGVSQSTKNNGLGNGDQGSPGHSDGHNAAENNLDNTTGTGNPPGSGNFPVVPT